MGGRFSFYGGQPCYRLARLNADGSLDSTFNPSVTSAGAEVNSLAVQADGRILVGGTFNELNGKRREYIGRLHPDGTLDEDFNPGADLWIKCVAVQADGKILVGGEFTTLGGQPRSHIGRLNPDGSLDHAFNPGANVAVECLAVQIDGKILAGGRFTMLGGQPRNRIGRLNNSEPATQSVASDGWNITWLRGSTSPEVWRTTFEASTNGVGWASLGDGERIPGGWQLTGVNLQTNTTIRARGFVPGGGVSSWFVETIAGPFNFTRRPLLNIRLSGGLPLLSIAGDVNRLYAVEFVPALASSNSWQRLTSLLLTNSPQSYLDSSGNGVTQRFYRVRLDQ